MATGSKELATINVDNLPAEKPMAEVEARAISKFAEASMLRLSEHEKEVLSQPVSVDEILIRPDGMIYLDWGWYANVLDDAFGKGEWSLTPAPWNPKLFREGNITYREYVLWVRGQFAGNAVGHHEETRRTANFGDAAESTYANALMRCCKRLGIARDLWRKSKIEQLKKLMKNPRPPQPEKVNSGTGKMIEVTQDSIDRMLSKFKDYEVSQEMIEKKLNHKIDKITLTEMQALKKTHELLEQGKSKEYVGLAD